jgi:hypothetical protein
MLLFIALQALDFITTVTAIGMGGGETNPVVRYVLGYGTVPGLALVKFTAVGIALLGTYFGKHNGVRKANVAFSCIVIWNTIIILHLATNHVA